MGLNGAFAENLNAIRRQKQLSIAEFAAELNIPRSTLQSILADGQTSLYTALRIAARLNMPVDQLAGSAFSVEDYSMLHDMLHDFDHLAALPKDKQERVISLLQALLEVIHA